MIFDLTVTLQGKKKKKVPPVTATHPTSRWQKNKVDVASHVTSRCHVADSVRCSARHDMSNQSAARATWGHNHWESSEVLNFKTRAQQPSLDLFFLETRLSFFLRIVKTKATNKLAAGVSAAEGVQIHQGFRERSLLREVSLWTQLTS